MSSKQLGTEGSQSRNLEAGTEPEATEVAVYRLALQGVPACL